jgi:RNA polymerase sigma-70 factor (ECF subfamily)
VVAHSVVSDDELLRRARDDAQAFGVFFDRHSLRVYRFLLRATGDHASATDLTSETFAQALLSLSRFRGRTEGAGVAWLFGIARRVLLRSLRSQRREATARRRLGVPTSLDGWDEAESDSRLDGERLSQALAHALARLPARQAEAIRLRVIQQLDYDQVATALGCSTVAARIRVSRGLRALLELLEGEAG